MRIISGLFKGRMIQSPKGDKTRPTSGRLREALFNICQREEEGGRFLDLFAGSGGMGLEALSRGASHVTFVDNSRESIQCIKENVKSMAVNAQVDILYGDVFDILHKLIKKSKLYDIIYADPPYALVKRGVVAELPYSVKVLNIVDEYHAQLLAPNGSIFLEDHADALPENYTLKSLVLKSSRQMGHSALQHFVHLSS